LEVVVVRPLDLFWNASVETNRTVFQFTGSSCKSCALQGNSGELLSAVSDVESVGCESSFLGVGSDVVERRKAFEFERSRVPIRTIARRTKTLAPGNCGEPKSRFRGTTRGTQRGTWRGWSLGAERGPAGNLAGQSRPMPAWTHPSRRALVVAIRESWSVVSSPRRFTAGSPAM